MKNPNHKSLLHIIREHINISSGLILRKDLVTLAIKNGNAESYVDQIRRQLTKVGYLEDTKQVGVYRVIARIPLSLTVDKLRVMYEKSFSNYNEKQKEKEKLKEFEKQQKKELEKELVEIEINIEK